MTNSNAKTYAIAEIFGPTIQGEGQHAGRPCLFLRLAGCNAWDGKPETRADSACPYCDTDFLPKERLTLDEIMTRLEALQTGGVRFGCVLTGGEPLLQADESLLECLSAAFPWVDIETNGTRRLAERPANVFLSCSPKAIPGHRVVCEPDWWKILVPDQLGHLQHALNSGRPVYVQPVCPDEGPAGPLYEKAVKRCLELTREHGCRLSLQMHKYLGVP